jgi:nicotinamide riboside kinase
MDGDTKIKMVRKTKYSTDEERLEARRESARKFYHNHKKECREKQNQKYYDVKDSILEEHKQMRAIYKLYKEGKLITSDGNN